MAADEIPDPAKPGQNPGQIYLTIYDGILKPWLQNVKNKSVPGLRNIEKGTRWRSQKGTHFGPAGGEHADPMPYTTETRDRFIYRFIAGI